MLLVRAESCNENGLEKNNKHTLIKLFLERVSKDGMELPTKKSKRTLCEQRKTIKFS